ncbi:hypothetical protein ACWEO2_11945 [Nocardia sp. NPDC004278]|uniref:hypothetical protein n=1 Tax=Nocardia sp. NPDC004604 TaxID=3157013 RepID=UPI0033AB3BB1
MSYPGGYPPQGQPGQWPGQPAYGQPAPQGAPNPYGAPPQYAPPAGQPPVSQPHIPQPPYGSQPHIPQPQYGSQPHLAQPQPYGQPAPPYGQQPYGQPPAPYGQPAPQQAGYGAPPAPPGITVEASYEWFSFLLAITKPKILVNGQRVPNTRWGQNHIPVGPGQYHVRVTTPWLFDMGPANATAVVQEGQGARFYYKPPAIIFLNGAIGPVPQKTPGVVFIYITWAFAALIILLNILLIAGASSI